MARTLAPDELHRRWSRACATSLACTERAARLVRDATVTRNWAVRVRLDAIELRERAALPRGEVTIASFCIQGLVDGVEAEARFEHGQLRCPEELLRRAEVLVAMGETFEGPGTRTVEATLDGPIGAVLLTVMRAFSRVFILEVGTRRAEAR